MEYLIFGMSVLSLVTGIICFIVGLKMGYNLSKGKLPKAPIEAIKTSLDKRHANKKLKQLDDELNSLMGITKEDMITSIKTGKDIVTNG